MKLLFKGVLLYTTLLLVILTILAIESIIDNGILIPIILLDIVLYFICKIIISKRDFISLTDSYKDTNM